MINSSPRTSLTIVSVALAAVAGGVSALAQPTITNLGVLPGNTESFGGTMNANGTVVGGTCRNGIGGVVAAFRWTAGGGLQNLGSLFGRDTYAGAISGDGSIVVGVSSRPGGTQAYRWTAASGIVSLGGLTPARYSAAYGISADGSHVVGLAENANGDVRAVRWHSGSIQILDALTGGGTYAAAYNISADASTIIGSSNDAIGNDVAVSWNSSGSVTSLGIPPGFDSTRAYATSANGSVIVGGSSSLNGSVRHFRWTAAEGMHIIDALGTDRFTDVYSVSGDGNIVTGASSGGLTGRSRAFLWSAALGTVDLNTYLPTLGLNLTGWTLQDAYISTDGTAMAGSGLFNGERRAWLINGIPTPGASPVCLADVVRDNVVDGNDFITFINSFGVGNVAVDAVADVAGGGTSGLAPDGIIDGSDFIAFINAFSAGC